MVQTLDIVLDVTEAEMLSEDYKVKLVLKQLTNGNTSYRTIRQERPLNIVGIDAPSKTLSVKFGGSSGGVYDVVVSNSQGKLVSSVTLTSEVEVLDFSPKSGSRFGGFVVTVTGRNFAPEAAQNPIKIGNDYCIIESVTDTQITCRVSENLTRAAETTTLIVFVSTFEEASCSEANSCAFTFIDES